MIRAHLSFVPFALVLAVSTFACAEGSRDDQAADTAAASTEAMGSVATSHTFLDPNTASREELLALPGMDSTAADAVIRGPHREERVVVPIPGMRRIERLYPGRDFRMAPDPWHNHGSSTVKHGRGSVLTVDLTNRCNMMCNPCFMDANQVGYVHELEWEDVKKLLDDAVSIKPRRQLSVAADNQRHANRFTTRIDQSNRTPLQAIQVLRLDARLAPYLTRDTLVPLQHSRLLTLVSAPTTRGRHCAGRVLEPERLPAVSLGRSAIEGTTWHKDD